MPGLRFRLFGFPVTIGLDFFFIALLIGLQARPGVYILEWIAVVAVSILIHELGHAFALEHYGVHPEIRLWGLGGLTTTGFVLPPRKSILVSLAGPLVGIPIAIAVMAIKPWLPASSEPLMVTTSDLIFVNLWWGIINLLPLAGLDGGHVVQNAFMLALGQSGRRPGQVVVGICSIAIAIGALFTGFIYLALVIGLFGFLNPEPYLALWHLVPGTGGRGAGRPKPTVVPPPKPQERHEERRNHDRPIAIVAVDSKRAFGEAYQETVLASGAGGGRGAGEAAGEAEAAGAGEGPPSDAATGRGPIRLAGIVRPVESEPDQAGAYETGAVGAGGAPGLDLDELERRPAPLLPDVAAMVADRDDVAVANRLAEETDPLVVLWIVTRVIEGKRVPQLLGVLRREGIEGRNTALLKLQVGLHALGRFGDALTAASILGRAGGPRSAVMEARSAARSGDRKRTAAALERALVLGPVRLSDAALGDIARLGPDRKVADLLARLRNAAPEE
jgi:Zn-dependent protease